MNNQWAENGKQCSRQRDHCFLNYSWFTMFCLCLLLSCMGCLYILENNPLLASLSANIFSESIGCPFVYSFLCMQKLLSFIRSYVFIFAFISFALGDWSKKLLVWLVSENVLPTFSSQSFMVSYLIFKSLSQFEFVCVCVCVCGVRVYSNFIDLHVAV